jgi:endonuclease/exonuclease/phosphatase family metal-dependent hydrolase
VTKDLRQAVGTELEGHDDHEELLCTGAHGGLVPHTWVRMEQEAVDRLARLSKMALDSGVAETVRAYANDLLDGHGAERAVVVLGDLNDEPLAATTQILLGPPGSEIGTSGSHQPDQGDARRLWNLTPMIPAERRFTRVFRSRPELIDHILASHALVSPLPTIDTGDVQLPSITENPVARRKEPASDHAPVVARFDLQER